MGPVRTHEASNSVLHFDLEEVRSGIQVEQIVLRLG